MIGQREDDCSLSLVEERCHDLDKYATRTYVSNKIPEDLVLNGKIYSCEERFPRMPPSLCVWPTSYQLEVSLHAEHQCYRRGKVEPWASFPRKVSSEDAALQKQKLRLRSGILELKTPTAFQISWRALLQLSYLKSSKVCRSSPQLQCTRRTNCK